MAVNRKTDSEINSGEVNDVNEVMIEKMMKKVTEMMDKKLNEMQKKRKPPCLVHRLSHVLELWNQQAL